MAKCKFGINKEEIKKLIKALELPLRHRSNNHSVLILLLRVSNLERTIILHEDFSDLLLKILFK